MNKINWFKRLFMSWHKLEQYFYNDLQESKKDIFEGIVKDKERMIEELRTSRDEKREEINKLKIELQKYITNKDDSQKETIRLNEKIQGLLLEKESLKTKLESIRDEKEKLNQNIHAQLTTLSRIEKTFFGKTGNKGKGKLGELQLSTLLQKSGLPLDFYTTNLVVGKNNVEFAIKSGKVGKWIPIDSKVLDTEVDEEEKIIIDKNYFQSVMQQAHNVSKYLSKSNTSSYGLLVLQNDAIYMQMYEENPQFFQQVIHDTKVYITSPSSFIQFAWSLSHILEIYEKVNKEEKIYHQIIDLIQTVSKFAVAVKNSYSSLKIAVETHYPTLVKRQNIVNKIIDSKSKMKDLTNLEDKKNYIDNK